jgi:hypothetical protein
LDGLTIGEGLAAGVAIGIPAATVALALLNFRRNSNRDWERDEREEAKRCFEERRLLLIDNKKKDAQIFELMLAALQDKGV